MQDPRPAVAVIIILFLLFAPDTPSQLQQHIARLDDVLTHERKALQTLNSSYLGDFTPWTDAYLDLAGLANGTGFGWSYLDEFNEQARNLTQHALGNRYQEKSLGQPVGEPLPLYTNISGVVHGEWVRNEWPSDIRPSTNRSLYFPGAPARAQFVPDFDRNLTGTAGRLSVRFKEDEDIFAVERRQNWEGDYSDVATFVTAHVSVESTDGSGDSWEVRAHGVHFLETGQIVLTTTSDKFDGIFALPHFIRTPYFFRIAQSLTVRAIEATLGRQRAGTVRSLTPFTSNADGTAESPFSAPRCELIVALQQHLVPGDEELSGREQNEVLGTIEQQLRFPTGIRFPSPQPMQFSMTAFSPDCGYSISSKGPPAASPSEANHLSGIKLEVEEKHARHHVLFYILVLSGQLWLTMRQMKEASTPSVRSRISFYTISMLALGDGFCTISFALISLFIPSLWVLLMATFFLAFLSVSFFGMRFLMEIWLVQAPERERRDRERRASALEVSSAERQAAALDATSAVLAAQPPTNAQPGLAPAPPAPPRRMLDAGSIPIMLPTEQRAPASEAPMLPVAAPRTTTIPTNMERRQSFGALYTRLCLIMMFTLFLSLNATSWPAAVRRAYFTTLAFIYLSFWLPQIYRNAYRNCRRALRWEFIIGQSLLRLSPFAYFYGYTWNILFAEVDLAHLLVLAVWLWVQGLALASQEILGPRWFIKEDWMPPAYDYHPVLHEDEEGGNLPAGSSATAPVIKAESSARQEARDDGLRVFDCAVCMQDLEVYVQTPNSSPEGGIAGAGGLLARRAYMMTPCRHIFHAKCLEGWMKYRLQCPICREDLPPM